MKDLNTEKSKPKNIEAGTALEWLKLGTIMVTDIGQENVYFVDQFGIEFYSKCYPYSHGNPINKYLPAEILNIW